MSEHINVVILKRETLFIKRPLKSLLMVNSFFLFTLSRAFLGALVPRETRERMDIQDHM